MYYQPGQIIRTYEGDDNVPLHYQKYTHDIVSHECGWVKTQVVGPEFYEPEATHDMYMNYDEWPPFSRVTSEAWARLQRFNERGFYSWGGVMAAGGIPVRQAIKLHEKGQQFLQKGCLIGPFFIEGDLILNAFKFYAPPEK